MKKTSRTWGKAVLGHRYPGLFLRYPRLISLVYGWNRITQLRNWYVHQALNRILNKAPREFTCLDLGSGEGLYLFPFSRKFPNAQFEGVDKTYSHIEFCHRYRNSLKARNVSLCFQELEALDRSQCAHVVICVGVLQYIEEDEQVLINIHRVLKNRGTLLLYVPIHGNFLFPRFGKFYNSKWNYEKSQARKRIYSPEEIVEKVQKAHLRISVARYTYGFWGKLAYEGYTYFLSHIIHAAWPGKLYGGLGVLLFLPFQLICMLFDFILPLKSGNGLLILASKE